MRKLDYLTYTTVTMPTTKEVLYSRKRLKYWRTILGAPPDIEVVAIIVASLPDDLALCKAMPRHGFWFNKTRQMMKVSPKELRTMLVVGRDEAIKLTQKHKSQINNGQVRKRTQVHEHRPANGARPGETGSRGDRQQSDRSISTHTD